MKKTDTNDLYLLESNDFSENTYDGQNYLLLVLPKYLQFSIIYEKQYILPPLIIYENDKKIIFLKSLPQNYYLAVHIPKQGMTGQTSYTKLEQAKYLPYLFYTDIALHTSYPLHVRKQSMNQNVDIEPDLDYTVIFIKIAGKFGYYKNNEQPTLNLCYLPKYNTDLQWIEVKIKPDEKNKWDDEQIAPPIAIHFQIINANNEKEIIIQTKSSIEKYGWTNIINDPLSTTYFQQNYGYEYGIFGQNNIGHVWRSTPNEFDDNATYLMQWKLTSQQINTLIDNQNKNKEFYLHVRYSIKKDDKNNNYFYYVWKDWSQNIKIKINTPPSAPINLKMSERT